MPLLRTLIRVVLTLAVVTMAIVMGVTLWDTYMIAPWTRDGRVRVYVVDVAPEVSGTVVQLPVVDNQFVHRGDPLFVLDPVRFRLAIREAQARLDGALEDLKLKQNDARRRMGLGGIVSAEEQEVFNSNVATQIASVDAARAALDLAKLNLQRSILYSPVNGNITNLNLRVGDYVTAGHARLAVIDADSYWVNGYFEETKMWGVHVGDDARVKLMGYKDILPGHVVSIARGINDQNGRPDGLGLQDVSPIFTWVRLAQRIPVRIHLDHVPDSVTLAAGMTATISVGPQSRTQRGRLTTWLQDHL
ncbi:p-hydroxybenzoic acid efflux pump subunit AaeA [Komagataeibacter europaeus]|uniref:ABC transporter/major facilitator superfamily multidrug resistance transporter HlyD/EmrA/FusE n=2 Tax=Komagataeibacter europaeus TaxID=33995 RepID=A0A0D6PW29_KOMEU|nr:MULTISPECIES: HlyD family secretion protein [Komagataeibacter]ARW17329.1 p-hydroxybenzoic acid efflux pump subunit AaeA [Komagataeibacter europaeus]KON65715.1 p-hydroxybenzoic acid efflux pump subunit AaeA [Komagataeibacter europaeus]MBE7730249.1 HlyD family secretion protein [Komagataeibacter sp. FXV3]GAN95218.1 ABC transporter/major facilitator superfamily multidrug resistance transporter HlyD/EmrA/FusE [Komagataeibacter europaeus NBRC 3261]GBQ43944.1 major facilitator superfamily multidr